MSEQEKKELAIAWLEDNRPSAPRATEGRRLQAVIDYAIACIKRDVNAEKIAEYKKGHADGVNDAMIWRSVR